MNPLGEGSSRAVATKARKHETFLRTNVWGNRQAAAVRKSLAGLWNVMSGAARRRAQAQWRADWCRVRFDEAAIEIEVQERPVWRTRVAWHEIIGVGIEPKGLLGPGFNLFVAREPGVVWASLDGAGAVALHDELRRRGVPFRPPADARYVFTASAGLPLLFPK